MFALVEPVNLLTFIYGADNAFLRVPSAIPAELIAVFELNMHHNYTPLPKTA